MDFSRSVRFYKMSGAGNDFIALPQAEDQSTEPLAEPSAEQVIAWCRRALSIGADGVFTLERRSHGAARMVHWNADGGRAELCLNGSRCAGRLAFELGWADSRLELETDSGTITCRPVDDDRTTIELPATIAASPQPLTLDVDGVGYQGSRVVVGVPHFVLPWQHSLADAPVAELGPRLRQHPDLEPAGANINFVRQIDRHRFDIRTFERGVEAETLACGSGVLATVRAMANSLGSPCTALTAGGYKLQVGGQLEAGLLSLTGDARIVAHGELTAAAERLTQLAIWT